MFPIGQAGDCFIASRRHRRYGQWRCCRGTDGGFQHITASIHDSAGAVAPFGAQGTAAAYEYQSGYKVGAGDRLTIRVAGESDLTADYLVDGSGNISLPYIQTVQIAGMTTPQVEKVITARLRNGYLRDPKVSVQATALRPFFIMGEVTTSGGFAYQSGITVQNAIAIAGGYAPRADHGPVLITRKM